MSKRPLFKVVTDLIFNQISVSNPLQNIWDIKNISSQHTEMYPHPQWSEWTDAIESLDESELNALNNELEKLFKHFNTGDFWQILVLSRKFTDIRTSLPAFDFEKELNKRSLTVSQFVSHFSKSIKNVSKTQLDEDYIENLRNDALAPMIDNAVFEGNEDTLIEIFSVVIWSGAIPADLLDEEIQIINTKNGRSYGDIFQTNNVLKVYGYKDSLLEYLLFLICELYFVKEEDLRNDDGGLSLTKIISHLRSYM
jgi:hypothetical protein